MPRVKVVVGATPCRKLAETDNHTHTNASQYARRMMAWQHVEAKCQKSTNSEANKKSLNITITIIPVGSSTLPRNFFGEAGYSTLRRNPTS